VTSNAGGGFLLANNRITRQNRGGNNQSGQRGSGQSEVQNFQGILLGELNVQDKAWINIWF
jgi:hypothetical protein